MTFALFAYNQEKYIREAIEGAFSQTYEPLEIIISDDCSTDRTFEIMQAMAASYVGVHSVRVRRNRRNLGLIAHVNTVFELAVGEVIVLAAGDDISEARRVSKITSVFEKKPEAMLVHSMVQVLNVAGRAVGFEVPPNIDASIIDIATSACIYIGATGAIKRELYDTYGPISERDTYEDLTFGFRAALQDGLFYVGEPLVKYRSNIGLASQFKRVGKNRRERRIALIRHRLATLKQRRNDLHFSAHPKFNEIAEALAIEERKAFARLQFYMEPFKFTRHLVFTFSYAYLKAFSSEFKYKIRLIDQ